MLEKINESDFIFTNEIGDDRINTKLVLDDYSWMHYTFETCFNI